MKVFILLSLLAGVLAELDCPANQHYESCGTACPKTCDNHNDPPQGCIQMCNPGCHCDEGFVKTKSGSCVKPESCNTNAVCSSDNERFNECGTACPLTCDNFQNPPKACTKQCAVGCECQEGYVKNKQGQCVLPSECPSFASANLCELEAETGMCRGYFPRFFFNKATGKCEEFVYGGCGGNENNFETLAECHDNCAAKDAVCGENEEFTKCGTTCPLTCDNLDNPPKFCTKDCFIGCACQKGYVQNAQGKCVKPEQCPNRAVCGKNQEFQECGTACPLTCDNVSNPPKVCTMQCVSGCACQKGYVKNAKGECVKPEQCQAVCGKNQEFQECGTACPLTCDNVNNPPICTMQCVSGCACQKGYVKDAQGECVKPEQCQAVCGKNQEFQQCGTACPLTCDNVNNPPKVCTAQCVSGCACQKGYVKNAQGECVKPEQCQAHNLCEQKAETGMCRGYFPRYHFNKATGQCEKFIYGGCGGNGNNFKTIEECKNSCAASKHAVCGENEEFHSCGTACPLTCDNLNNPPKFCTMNCVVGCQCQKGYAKNAQGKCVLPEQCPSKAVCGENEEFQECGTACPLTCDNLDNPPKFCTKQCNIGCACQKGYVKNAKGECVLPEQCPNRAAPVCGRNQEWNECETACPRTCDNLNNRPKFCTLQCIIGCACQKGYVKNAQGECVLPEQCPSRALDRPDCDKAPETGNCKAAHTRWYYDQEAGMCKIFVYGGCGGNRNNFQSRDECYNKCGALAPPKNALCAQEKVVGPCRAAFHRYFYNQKTGECEQFIYGGCHGNGNNFVSKEQCHATCLA